MQIFNVGDKCWVNGQIGEVVAILNRPGANYIVKMVNTLGQEFVTYVFDHQLAAPPPPPPTVMYAFFYNVYPNGFSIGHYTKEAAVALRDSSRWLGIIKVTTYSDGTYSIEDLKKT